MTVKVLIVDDSALMRKLFTQLFEKEGFIVQVARNGEEALTKAVEFEPDCITLDINMPGNGWHDVSGDAQETLSLSYYHGVFAHAKGGHHYPRGTRAWRK